MVRLDFHIEFNIEVPNLEEELAVEAEQRLWLLAEQHTDLVGASVAVEELAQDDVPFLYQARVVVYIRQENIAAVEKAESVEAALKGALTAIERQVRERRERLGATWQRPDQGVYGLTAREIYDTYSDQIARADLHNLDRNAIASQLMINVGLDQETAYYAADQILQVAQETPGVQ
jgi:ribosome-associated translation inhibitor RaiA